MSGPPSFARTWWANIVDRTPVNGWQRYVFMFPNGCGACILAQPDGWHAALVARKVKDVVPGKDEQGAWRLACARPPMAEALIGEYVAMVADYEPTVRAAT